VSPWVLGYVHNSVAIHSFSGIARYWPFYFILFAYSDIFRPRASMMASVQCHRHAIAHCVPATIVAMLRCWYRHMAAIVGRCNRELRTTWRPGPLLARFWHLLPTTIVDIVKDAMAIALPSPTLGEVLSSSVAQCWMLHLACSPSLRSSELPSPPARTLGGQRRSDITES
jgi:hypothetical protein